MTSDSGATTSLSFPDPQAVADLRTFVTRARAADDGAVRLQVSGAVLAAYVCILKPAFFGESGPTVLGMRAMELGEDGELDITVSLGSLADRLARMDSQETVMAVPTVTVTEAWTGISAPRSGWNALAELPADELITAARSGITEIAEALPVQPGVLVVNSARAKVWGKPLESGPAGVPTGAAFAAFTLGFLEPGGTVVVLENGRWLRLASRRGHVLVRRPAAL